jgi:outer membrane protein assembly factor BamB
MMNQINTCVLVNGYLYRCHGPATMGGTLRCVNFKSGKLMWEKDLGRPVCLSAANNFLIILNDQGMLHVAEASPVSYKEIPSVQIFPEEKLSCKYWTSPVLCNGRIYCRSRSGTITCVDMRK